MWSRLFLEFGPGPAALGSPANLLEMKFSAPPQTCWIRNSGDGSSSMFQEVLQAILVHVGVWDFKEVNLGYLEENSDGTMLLDLIWVLLFSNSVFCFLFFFFLAALGLCCCAWTFSSCSARGLLLVVVHWLLIQWLLLLQSTGSRRAGFSSCGTQAQ